MLRLGYISLFYVFFCYYSPHLEQHIDRSSCRTNLQIFRDFIEVFGLSVA